MPSCERDREIVVLREGSVYGSMGRGRAWEAAKGLGRGSYSVAEQESKFFVHFKLPQAFQT